MRRKEKLLLLIQLGFTETEAAHILEIAEEYSKPHRGKYNGGGWDTIEAP